jgi:hypothetical protein
VERPRGPPRLKGALRAQPAEQVEGLRLSTTRDGMLRGRGEPRNGRADRLPRIRPRWITDPAVAEGCATGTSKAATSRCETPTGRAEAAVVRGGLSSSGGFTHAGIWSKGHER